MTGWTYRLAFNLDGYILVVAHHYYWHQKPPKIKNSHVVPLFCCQPANNLLDTYSAFSYPWHRLHIHGSARVTASEFATGSRNTLDHYLNGKFSMFVDSAMVPMKLSGGKLQTSRLSLPVQGIVALLQRIYDIKERPFINHTAFEAKTHWLRASTILRTSLKQFSFHL